MLLQLLEEASASNPDGAAIRWRGLSWSWIELLTAVHARADELRRGGMEAGDGLGILLPNGPEFVISFFAGASLGAAAVPLSPGLRPSELERLLAGCRVTALVCTRELAATGHEISRALGRAVSLLVSDPHPKPPAPPSRVRAREPVEPDAPALHGFSSGTTGTAKRIVRTQAQLCHEAANYCATVGLGPDDVVLGVVPFFHAHGLGNCVLAAVRSRATLVVPDSADRHDVLEAIERERVTVFPAVPLLVRTLASRETRADLSSLRLCFTAGTALPPSTFDLFRARFGRDVRQLYGCTEAGSVCINLDPDASATRESVGAPIRNVEIAVVDENRRPCSPGVVGEIAIRSPAAGSGYEGLDEVNRQVFRDGWLYSGDLGALDGAGRLAIRGRRKLFIDHPVGKVDPVEVERCATGHPQVVDAGAVGVPSVHGGELVKLVVAVGPGWRGTTRELRRELVARCREQLAEFKVPRILELRRELPRSASGKVLRARLVESDPEALS